jgi:hypothetical protein
VDDDRPHRHLAQLRCLSGKIERLSGEMAGMIERHAPSPNQIALALPAISGESGAHGTAGG